MYAIRSYYAGFQVRPWPSTDPREKRLAVRTDDHSLDAARFEGRTPGGRYGESRVIVWDIGTWRPRGRNNFV